MLRWRLLLGAIFIAALVGLFALDARCATPGAWLFPLALLLAAACSDELLGLMAAGGMHPSRGAVCVGTLLVVAANGVPLFCRDSISARLGSLGWPLAALALAMLGAFVVEIIRYRQPGGVTQRLCLALGAITYLGVGMSFVVQLRIVSAARDVVPLAALLLVVKLGDIGAYTVGRLVGRHKLAPHVSPGKTIEGLLGGLALACGGAWLALAWLPERIGAARPEGPGWAWAAFGLAVAVAGVVGDLSKSLIKRDVGRKDSSTWLPGFGGVLDLVDSPLGAAPVAYLAWVLLC